MPILHWLNKEEALKTASKVPYRLLEVDETLSYGDPNTENMLIQGDNLEALKALLPYYAGKVKFIYIDPPYNTKSAFEHYDDNLEHSKWLNMMYPRLQILWELLSADGIILISINDDEGHYLKVLCDELFGRKNFITSLIWNYEGNTDNQAKIINYHEYIHFYAKSGVPPYPNIIDPNISDDSKLFKDQIRNTVVKNGPKNPMSEILLPPGFPASIKEGVIKVNPSSYPIYDTDLIIKNFQLQNPVVANSGWSSKKILESFIANNFNSVEDSKGQSTRFELTQTGAIEGVKVRKQNKGHFVSVLRGFGTTNQMRLFLEKMNLKFDYPKPIGLISYLIEAFTSAGDIVLDSFAGSGTTAHAVMNVNKLTGKNRRFIIIELRKENMLNVILPRLKGVIKGNKEISILEHPESFCFYSLGEQIFDEWGEVNKVIRFQSLAAHIWFSETRTPFSQKVTTPLLGIHDGVAYYLLYNGILGDKRPKGGNVLTSAVLDSLPPYEGSKVIYGESCRVGAARLEENHITFKQTPYDIKAR